MGWTFTTRERVPLGGELDFLEQRTGIFDFTSLPAAERPIIVARELKGEEAFFAMKVPAAYHAARQGVGECYEREADGSTIVAIVILTAREGGDFGWKEIDELMGPYTEKKPSAGFMGKLTKLSQHSRADYARAWRGRCGLEVKA